MSNNHNMKVKCSNDIVWRVIDGDVVVLLPEGAMLNALKGCGSRVWELMQEEDAVPAIIQRICDEYDVEPQVARDEINEFVRNLAEMKLVEITPPASEGTGQ